MISLKVGIIGGSGLDDPDILENRKEISLITPFGQTSDCLLTGTINNVQCVLLARHGRRHEILPTNINYRANIWALREIGCSHIIVSTACGSLKEDIVPGSIVIPDDFIDRTTKRVQTFYDGASQSPIGICHLPMFPAFHNGTRNILIAAVKAVGYKCFNKGTIVSIEGPRFSSRSESLVYKQWGADLVNMTTCPEVVLAKEAGLLYASVAMATDYDCWRQGCESVNVQDVLNTFNENAFKVKKILIKAVELISESDWTNDIKKAKEDVLNNIMLPKHIPAKRDLKS